MEFGQFRLDPVKRVQNGRQTQRLGMLAHHRRIGKEFVDIGLRLDKTVVKSGHSARCRDIRQPVLHLNDIGRQILDRREHGDICLDHAVDFVALFSHAQLAIAHLRHQNPNTNPRHGNHNRKRH